MASINDIINTVRERTFSDVGKNLMMPGVGGNDPNQTLQQVMAGGGGGGGPFMPGGGGSYGAGGGGGAIGYGKNYASTISDILQGAGITPQKMTPSDAMAGAGSDFQKLMQQIMSQNPELAKQIGQTSGTTTLGGASGALTDYWTRIARDNAASVMGAGAVGMDSLLGMIPKEVTGMAAQYQGQQENYMANLLGLQNRLSGEALGTSAGMWQTGMNQTYGMNELIGRSLVGGFEQGAGTGSDLMARIMRLGQGPLQLPGGSISQMQSMNEGDYSGWQGQNFYNPNNSGQNNGDIVNQKFQSAFGDGGWGAFDRAFPGYDSSEFDTVVGQLGSGTD